MKVTKDKKVVIISKSDAVGGAAVVTARLMEALREEGVDVKMLVADKASDLPGVECAANRIATLIPFLIERLKIFISNGFHHRDLFKVDTASDGLPLWRHPWVKEADVVMLGWVNQGLLSLKGIEKIAKKGKKIIWTMHDMWCATGICHHAGTCRNYLRHCGNCPFMGKNAHPTDLSHKTWLKKHRLFDRYPIQFVAVSNWMASKARESMLLKNADIFVIPNPFPIDDNKISIAPAKGKMRVVMGAARLDDPIKGLPIMIEATKVLKEKYPDKAENLLIQTFGHINQPEVLEEISLPHEHLGKLRGEGALRRVYDAASIVVSSSLFETLPGTLVEGQAYGCVPVAFDRGGQRDIVTHLRTGYIATLPDSIKGTDVYACSQKGIREAAEALAEGIVWAMESQSDEMRARMHKSITDKFAARNVARRYIDVIYS